MDIGKIRENALIIVSTAVVLSAIAYLATKRDYEKKEGFKEIPYPNAISLPVFGHIFSMLVSPTRKCTQWHGETGPIFKFNMGNQLWIMIGDPFLAHDIFVKAAVTTSSRPYHRFARDIYGKNNKGIIFIKYDEQWKNKRRAVNTVLSLSSVKNFSDVIDTEIERLMTRFTEISQIGKPVDPYKEILLTTLNVILVVAVANRYEGVEDQGFKKMHYCLDELMKYGGPLGDISSYLPSLKWLINFSKTEKEMHKLIDKHRDPLYKKLIDDGMKNEKHSLVKMMYKMKEDGNIDDDDILVFINDFINGGADTTAISLNWAFSILSQHPDVQEKLAKELDVWKAKNSDRDVPNFDQDRDDLPYSICVQKEIARFQPIGGFGIPHLASEDTTVNGYFIPKGSVLASSMPAMHINSSIYESPSEFIPERFMEKQSRSGAAVNRSVNERDHFVFGWGRRACPGINLAEVQIFNFYVRFFSKFTIKPELDFQGNPMCANPTDFIDLGIILKPLPLKYYIVARSP